MEMEREGTEGKRKRVSDGGSQRLQGKNGGTGVGLDEDARKNGSHGGASARGKKGKRKGGHCRETSGERSGAKRAGK